MSLLSKGPSYRQMARDLSAFRKEFLKFGKCNFDPSKAQWLKEEAQKIHEKYPNHEILFNKRAKLLSWAGGGSYLAAFGTFVISFMSTGPLHKLGWKEGAGFGLTVAFILAEQRADTSFNRLEEHEETMRKVATIKNAKLSDIQATAAGFHSTVSVSMDGFQVPVQQPTRA